MIYFFLWWLESFIVVLFDPSLFINQSTIKPARNILLNAVKLILFEMPVFDTKHDIKINLMFLQ